MWRMGLDELNILFERWDLCPPLEEINMESILMTGMRLKRTGGHSAPGPDRRRQSGPPSTPGFPRESEVDARTVAAEFGAPFAGPVPKEVKAVFNALRMELAEARAKKR